jgi:hypothetical protein
MAIRYEVTAQNEVLAWNDELEQTEPFLYQPYYPNGEPFADTADAQAWADTWYAAFIDPDNNPEPPSSPAV